MADYKSGPCTPNILEYCPYMIKPFNIILTQSILLRKTFRYNRTGKVEEVMKASFGHDTYETGKCVN